MHGYFASLMTNSISGFLYRKDVIIDNTGSHDASGFLQLKLTLNSGNFDFNKANADGRDIRFYNGFENLNYFKESYNSVAQTAVFYVKTNLKASVNNVISIYYGNQNILTASNFAGTMQRFEPSRSGGDTKYLLKLDEGTGAISVNNGSLGGNISVQNNWAIQNNYGFTGSALQFNGTSNNISINSLLDTYPVSGEISFSFIADSLVGDKKIFSKNNRLSSGALDNGDSINLFINSSDVNKLYFTSNNGSLTTTLKSTFPIEAGICYKITVAWENNAIGLYVNGYLTDRKIFNRNNGIGTSFKIGCATDVFNSQNILFFNGKINDFRFSDYTNGNLINLPEIESEHSLIRFYEKNKRTKLVTKKLINTNFPEGNIINAKGEPFGFFENNKYKLYTRSLHLNYRVSDDPFGLHLASDITIVGGGVAGETNPPACLNMLKENGVYYMFYCYDTFNSDLFVVSSTDGVNFGNKKTALIRNASGWASIGLVNSSVIKKDGLFYMLVEVKDPNLAWSIGLATSSLPDGPYSFSGINPISALKQSPNGSSGGPNIWFNNGYYHLIYHANPFNNTKTHDDTYYAKTLDFVNYTIETKAVLSVNDDIMAHDQTSDATIFTDGIKTYVDFTPIDNRNPLFVTIKRAVFNGTLDMFNKDLTITIGAEQAL